MASAPPSRVRGLAFDVNSDRHPFPGRLMKNVGFTVILAGYPSPELSYAPDGVRGKEFAEDGCQHFSR